MGKFYKYLIFIILLSFSFCFNVEADCSYSERKELSNKAKEVEIIIEPKVEVEKISGETSFGESTEFYQENYTFDIQILNISKELYIKYYTTANPEKVFSIDHSDITSGTYNIKGLNSNKVETYKFELYSTNENCYGKLITTKTIKKPKYNIYSSFDICYEKELEDYKYCKKYVTEDIKISESDFIERANKYKNIKKETIKEEEPKMQFADYIKKYWYFSIPVFVIGISIIVLVKIRKKRSEL